MQVSASAHKCLRISNKAIKYLIQKNSKARYFKQVLKMRKIASCIYCLNKDISMASNVIFVSFECACNQEVIFYRNSLAGRALGARY